MRTRRLITIVIAGMLTTGLTALVRGQAAKKAAGMPQHHIVVAPGDLKWGPAPPVLPAGAQVAVVDGDPFKPGFFAMRLKMPDGYKIAAHWHPTDENIVVLQGTFRIGAGDAYSESGLKDLGVGGFTKLPKEMHHFAGAKGETVIQIYGPGPFVINYLNPADDPSKKSSR
jgi:ChrR-like protein with cupin domain